MAKSGNIHSIWASVRHFFTSWNTTGEGIHSPYLFHLVRFVIRDRNPFYCFAEIERKKAHLNASEERTDVGQMVFRVVYFMGQHEKRPLKIVEVGATTGIITAYLASPDSRNEVKCMDEDSLYIYARERIDVVYVHGGFTNEEVKKMADFVLPRLTEKGVLIVEGIHETKETELVWKELQEDTRVTSSMDVLHAGLLFVDKHYLKRNYIIRL